MRTTYTRGVQLDGLRESQFKAQLRWQACMHP